MPARSFLHVTSKKRFLGDFPLPTTRFVQRKAFPEKKKKIKKNQRFAQLSDKVRQAAQEARGCTATEYERDETPQTDPTQKGKGNKDAERVLID